MPQDWGRIFVANRYENAMPTDSAESINALVQFGMRNAPAELVHYVEVLEEDLKALGWQPQIRRPDELLRVGDVRGVTYTKTMHKAANVLARDFLESDCDSICFIDSDAVFGSGALEELRNDPEGWEYDVLQAFTVKRGWPPEPMFMTLMPEEPVSDLKYGGIHFETNLPIDADHIYPVDAVSLHFTLIRRSVFEKLIVNGDPRHTYWFEYREDNGEDITFSINARRAGAKLGMTTRLKIGHGGHVVTGWDTMIEYYDRRYAVAAGEPPASLDRIRRYFEAQRQLSELVAEYTGEDCNAVYQKASSGPWLVNDQWLAKKPETVDQVHAFYGTTPLYLYSLIKWNSTPVFQRILGRLQDVRGEKILEFGGGIGTAAEFLASHGNHVDYYDLPGGLLDFAKWRLKKFNSRVRFVEQWEIAGGDGQGYDRIVAIDVLEHLHPSEFDFVCDGLLMGLKPGGLFFAHNNWEKPDQPFPSHFDHSAKWQAFVSRHGLVQIDELAWRKPEVMP